MVVVSILAFYTDDPRSNPSEVYIFSVKLFLEKSGSKQKEAGVVPITYNRF